MDSRKKYDKVFDRDEGHFCERPTRTLHRMLKNEATNYFVSIITT